MFSKQQQQHELPAALFRQCNLNRNPIKSTAGMCRPAKKNSGVAQKKHHFWQFIVRKPPG